LVTSDYPKRHLRLHPGAGLWPMGSNRSAPAPMATGQLARLPCRRSPGAGTGNRRHPETVESGGLQNRMLTTGNGIPPRRDRRPKIGFSGKKSPRRPNRLRQSPPIAAVGDNLKLGTISCRPQDAGARRVAVALGTVALGRRRSSHCAANCRSCAAPSQSELCWSGPGSQFWAHQHGPERRCAPKWKRGGRGWASCGRPW
jgi:hypothetical protein